jgi:hypothetical protein
MQESEQNRSSKMNQPSNSPTGTRRGYLCSFAWILPSAQINNLAGIYTGESHQAAGEGRRARNRGSTSLSTEAKNKTEKQTKGTAALLSEAAKLKSDAWLGTR